MSYLQRRSTSQATTTVSNVAAMKHGASLQRKDSCRTNSMVCVLEDPESTHVHTAETSKDWIKCAIHCMFCGPATRLEPFE